MKTKTMVELKINFKKETSCTSTCVANNCGIFEVAPFSCGSSHILYHRAGKLQYLSLACAGTIFIFSLTTTHILPPTF